MPPVDKSRTTQGPEPKALSPLYRDVYDVARFRPSTGDSLQ